MEREQPANVPASAGLFARSSGATARMRFSAASRFSAAPPRSRIAQPITSCASVGGSSSWWPQSPWRNRCPSWTEWLRKAGEPERITNSTVFD